MSGSEYFDLHEHPLERKHKMCHRLSFPSMQMNRKWFALSIFTLLFLFYVLLKIELEQLNIDFPSITGEHSLIMLMLFGWDPMQDWTNCMSKKLLNRKKDWEWEELDGAVTECGDMTPVRKIEVKRFGSDEFSRFGVTTGARQSTLVSFGPLNTIAEEALRESQPQLIFHGVNSSNLIINSSFHAIGRIHTIDFEETPIFSLKKLSHNQKELISLLQDKVQRSFIDHLWINAGSFGHEFLSLMHRGGPLDAENIEVCQVNFEMRSPSTEQRDHFASFLAKSLQHQRFYFVRSELQKDRYLAYFINMENAACITKYFLRFF
ncbi:hypothetical protein PMAYCL1PPCAC_28756 [Pristionchus mayeri]|uniref:Methyltransferase n=1 Tax=Pristionchus mayeri TaxID=1317129 RepID=A0AAN5IDF5_9BILA|nr:hypothetical protein PMAYCL1PPCAC_28756 [Pristionchus mayeri]